jgi:hypothetical protein
MQLFRNNSFVRIIGFFRIAINNDTLMNYYISNFTMAQFYHYSLSELDNMYPWEREVYMSLLNKHIQEENERRKNGKN